MRYEPTATDMDVLFGLGGVFFVCALLRMVVVRKIVVEAGKDWRLSKPFKRSRIEWEAVKALQPGRLRTQYRSVMATGVGAWLLMAFWMMFRELRTK